MKKSIYSHRQERLAKLLREARKSRGLTQQQLADRLKKPQSFVAKVEGSERRLDVIEFLAYCEELETPAQELLIKVMG